MVPCNVTSWYQIKCYAVTLHALWSDMVRRNVTIPNKTLWHNCVGNASQDDTARHYGAV